MTSADFCSVTPDVAGRREASQLEAHRTISITHGQRNVKVMEREYETII
jgi:hypothetical protein